MSRPEVTVLLFSVLRDRAGTDRVVLGLDGIRTVGEAADRVFARYPSLAPYRTVVRFARNQVYADRDQPVSPGDEIACITPVSGG